MKINKSVVIRNVLLISAFLVFILAIVGGYTRLQKAGLSITEWRPVTGIIPPLSNEDWQEEFEKYKSIAQYKLVHQNITLEGFKRIYLIEYFHRLIARLAGVFIFVSFIYLLIKKEIRGFWIPYFVVLFILFGFQGFLGWLMVRTGVVREIPFVDPVFLAFHKMFAILVFSYVLLGAFLSDNGSIFRGFSENLKVRKIIIFALIVFLIQTFFGALLAGHKGALVAPTYPDINGVLIPSYMLSSVHDIIANPVFVNFFHRHFPWLILVVFVVLIKYSKIAFVGIFLWFVQFFLGLFTLLFSRGDIPWHLALAHQANAWILYSFIIYILYSTFLYVPEQKFKIIT
ncbi:MAG: COX15/CtaA family protein [Candidatus Calescibacterium sp.]|nr:COX15/CtaA family protein [Candidatus Calescibacterium sp.]MCX7734362.1 COX15/CtaA family protein [bacterium]MDW8086874.1 COX15/CtaA family protein [Candidatus Calescibacterium sp.]